MASTAADIIASAKAEANAAKQSAMASLGNMTKDLTSAYNQQQSATNALYQNTLNQLQSAYQTDAKAAYGNYMTEKQNLTNQLNRLGLQNSGYGVSQGLISGAAYSKNLAGLQNTLATNKANTTTQQQQALADLYSTYAKNKMSADQFAYEAAQKAYDTAYSNTYQAKQDEIANALQQQYYNYLMSQGSGGGGYGGGGGGSYYSGGGSSGGGSGDVPVAGGNKNNKTTTTSSAKSNGWTSTGISMNKGNTSKSAKEYGTFSNGYQPKGISGYGKLQKSGKTTTVNGKEQNIWLTTGDGKTRAWVWDGKNRVYVGIS